MPAKPAIWVVHHWLVRNANSARLSRLFNTGRVYFRYRVRSDRLLCSSYFGLPRQMLQTLLYVSEHLLVIANVDLWLRLLSFRHFVVFEVCIRFSVVFSLRSQICEAFGLKFPTMKHSLNGLITTDPKIKSKNSSPSAMKLSAPITRQLRDSQIPLLNM